MSPESLRDIFVVTSAGKRVPLSTFARHEPANAPLSVNHQAQFVATTISFNLARGNAIDCGCFDVAAAGKTVAERITDMRWVVIRDLGMLAMVAQILWATGRDEPESA